MAWKLDAPAVLARHGIDPVADEAALAAALAARGWTGRVEELGARPGATRLAHRYQATAFRTGEPGHGRYGTIQYRRATGRTAEGALGRVLAAVLERGDRLTADEAP